MRTATIEAAKMTIDTIAGGAPALEVPRDGGEIMIATGVAIEIGTEIATTTADEIVH